MGYCFLANNFMD